MSCSNMTFGGISLENFFNKEGMVWSQMNNDFHANCFEGEYNQGACYTMLEQELAVAK